MMFKVAALYEFVPIADPPGMQELLMSLTQTWDILGGLIIAEEGLNGTIAGTPSNVDNFLRNLTEKGIFLHLELKISYSEEQPFFRMRIQIKNEIITMGQPSVHPHQVKGIDIHPADWNKLIEDPEVMLIDTRNEYEIQVGTFQYAINPHTLKFSDFPAFVRSHLDPIRHRKVAMFCTGNT